MSDGEPRPTDSTGEQPPAPAPTIPVDGDDARRAVAAILASPTFERAPRLKELLRYIADLTLRGEGERINEYLVGVEVFARGNDYAPSDDAIVRRQAHALRQKLLKYYSEEGASEPIRIELPVGGYVPTFNRRRSDVVSIPAPQHAPPVAVDAMPIPPAPAHRQPGLARRLALPALVGAAAGVVGWAAGRRSSPTTRLHPAIAAVWGPWLRSDHVVVCLSNPLTAQIRHAPAEIEFADPASFVLPGDGEADRRLREGMNVPAGRRIWLTPDSTTQGKLGEAYAGIRLAEFFGRHGVSARPMQSRFVNWEVFREQNVIVLGHGEMNRWIEPLLDRYPMRVVPLKSGPGQRIVFRAPGGDRFFQNSLSFEVDGLSEQHALVSMLPGVDARRSLLVVAGLYAPVTDIAAEFLTSPEGLAELVARLTKESPAARPPWHFQTVLRAKVRDRVAARVEIVEVVTLPQR